MSKRDEVLTVGIDVDIATAVRAMDRFEKDMKKRMKAVSKIAENLNKTNIDGIQKVTDNLDDWLDDLDDLALAHDKQNKKLQTQIDLIERLRKKESSASDDQKASIQANIKALEQQAKQTGKVLTKRLMGKAQFNQSIKAIGNFMEKGVEHGSAAFSSFFNKDLKGLVENSAKTSGKLFGFMLKKSASGAMKGGNALSKRGDAMGGAGGAAMKMMGGAMSKIGGAFGTLAKLGPILASMSTVLLAVVKIMIDAEAQAKQFNKDLLQGASTTEFLAANAGNARVAFSELKDTLGQVRDAAYDAGENLDWGINADDHKAIYETLRSEGVSLASISAQAKVAGQSVRDFSTELVHTNVAFSRGIGVPLQEISSFQAEMMTSLGMSLDTTKLAFSQMTRSASESGIAANKFFQIIRSVSTDLSLYNTRMEQAVKTLKLLGKVMDPKNAQKFMQSITQAFKTMGQDDRLKVALLAGGKGQQIVQKDLANKKQNLNKDIAGALGQKGKEAEEDIARRLADPKTAKGLWKEVEAKAKDKFGALRESSLELGFDEKASKKGVYGQAFAMENLGVGAGLDMMKAAIAPWGGGDLRAGAGSLGMTKMAENMGIGTTELRGMMKVEQAVEDQKNSLLEQAQSAEEKAKIHAMSTQDIIDSMSEEEQKILEDSSKNEMDYAKQQGDLTQSLLDKLSVLVDFVMNQIYNVMQSIWESVSDLVGIFGGGSGNRDIEKLAFKSKDANLAKAMQGGGSGSDIAGRYIEGGGGQAISKALSDYDRIFGDLDKRIQSGDRGAMSERESLIASDKGAANAASSRSAISSSYLSSMSPDQLLEAAKQAGLGEDKIAKLKGSLYEEVTTSEGFGERQKMVTKSQAKKGVNLEDALNAAGVGEGDRTGILQKGLHSMKDDPAKLLEMATKVNEEIAKTGYDSQKILEDTSKAAQDLHKDATNDGTLYVRFSSSFLNNDYAKTIEESVLSAMRLALFEFYMYSEVEDRQQAIDYMNTNGMDPQGFAEFVSDSAQGLNGKPAMTAMDAIGGTPTDDAGGEPKKKKLPANAAGGIVTDTSSGLAQVRAAAGEGLASVGRGERIVPAGGGGVGNINIQVDGVGGSDLARMVRATVIDTVAEYKRRERFTP